MGETESEESDVERVTPGLESDATSCEQSESKEEGCSSGEPDDSADLEEAEVEGDESREDQGDVEEVSAEDTSGGHKR